MKKRFEFCYLDHRRRPTFAIMWDDSLVSACERLLGRPIQPSEIDVSPNGNYFIRGWEPNEVVSVKETECEASGTFSLGDGQKPQSASTVINLNLGDLDLSKK